MITAHHLVFGRKYGVDFDTFIYSEISGINGFLPVTQNGTLSFTTDRKGGNTAVQFGSGYLQTVNNLPASSVWSFSFWIKTTDNNSSQQFISFAGLTPWDREFGLLIASGQIRAEINNAGVEYLNVGITQGDVINNNTWQHIVIIFEPNQSAENEIKIYINGILRTLYKPFNNDTTGNFVSKKLVLGKHATNPNYFIGIMDDIKLFNYPLTQSEITNLYNE